MDKRLFPPRKIEFAKTLRRQPTKGENRLWFHLRNRQLGGFKFRRQCAVGPFIADFACIEAKLIVEIDGPSHDGRQAYDSARTAFLERRGFYVLRFAVEDIRENLDGTLEVIYAHAVARRDAPRA